MPSPQDIANDVVFKRISALVEDMDNNASLHNLALGWTRIVKSRTRKGIDVSGSPFQDYTRKYKAYKAHKLGLPVSPVNLQVNDIDGMLASVTHEVRNGKAFIFAKGRRKSGKRRIKNMDLIRWHSFEGVGKRGQNIRNFWGINEQTEMPKLIKIAKDDVNNLILAKLR